MPNSQHWSEYSDPRDYTYTFSKSDPDVEEKWNKRFKRSRIAYAVEELFWIVVIIVLSIILGSILTSGVVLLYALAFTIPFVYSFGKAMRWIK
jgi:hypothetical protein